MQADSAQNMKYVDHPWTNPKRITIQSSRECFGVDIPRLRPTTEQSNPSHVEGNPSHVERPTVINETVEQMGSGDDDATSCHLSRSAMLLEAIQKFSERL